MQLSPHKIDTTLVISFLDRTTRFKSGVYLYCYDPLIETRRQGHCNQSLIEHDPLIELPSDLPTGRYPRGTLTNQAPDILIEIPIARSPPQPIESPGDKTTTRPTKQNSSPSRSPDQTLICSHNIPINIMIELQIYRSIPLYPDQFTD